MGRKWDITGGIIEAGEGRGGRVRSNTTRVHSAFGGAVMALASAGNGTLS